MDEFLIIQFPIIAEPPLTDEKAILQMTQGLETLIEIGAIKGPLDEVLKNYEVDLGSGYSTAYLSPDALVDGSKLNTVGSSKAFEFPKDLISQVDLSEFNKTFSAATIQERLRLSKMNPKVRMRYMVMDYKRFFNANKTKLEKNPEQAKSLKDMFLTDLMGVFNEILPYIEEGKQLNTLIGISQITPSMNKVARDLSLIYKRALKAEKSSGQISKSIYSKLKETYAEFMNQLLITVFPGIEQMDLSGGKGKTVKMNPAQTTRAASRTYSYCKDGRVDLFCDLTSEELNEPGAAQEAGF